MLVTVRPEKIGFADGGGAQRARRARSVTRIFQGNHWLYQIDTPAGRVTVIRQNSGRAGAGRRRRRAAHVATART